MAAAVAVAARDVRQRRYALADPDLPVRVLVRENPVADGECRAFVQQRTHEPRQDARAQFPDAIVQANGLAVDLRDAHEPQRHVFRHGQASCLAGQRRCQSKGRQ
jgi:hypothetical protein